jgi:hypothetical protein
MNRSAESSNPAAILHFNMLRNLLWYYEKDSSSSI